MAEYIMLFNYTSKGLQNIKDAPKRMQDTRKLFEQSGAKVKALYSVLGHYDTVCIADAPNDETIAKLSLQLGLLGNVKCETLRAFSEDQTLKLIGELA